MKIILLATVVAMVLLGLFGTDSSVGGSMGMMMVAVVAVLAAGIYDAAAHARGPLGWITSIVVAIIGGFAAIIIFGPVVKEMIVSNISLKGSLASSQHPIKHVAFAAIGAITVLGSWGALAIVEWLRQVRMRRVSNG